MDDPLTRAAKGVRMLFAADSAAFILQSYASSGSLQMMALHQHLLVDKRETA
ncbi:hypothetical protein C7445_11087 [Alicyclobacillus sacchari]|uniref:Uncharacterized protein n=1 Tax=Alicyclobacillus sacchari TaxID=392010 RepID=A0A4R8LJS2_9BACL|nr:hypothetical protein C7445_11087 [Alicyclobacillus sacchari]